MNKVLMAELEKLDADERLRLAYDLLDSVAQGASATPITEGQRRELRRRLAEYRANPDEPAVTLADIRRQFSSS
jgi:putative addiction module component (TIGR02574 family)